MRQMFTQILLIKILLNGLTMLSKVAPSEGVAQYLKDIQCPKYDQENNF